IRSTAYKLSNLIAKGALVWIAGALTLNHGKFDGWALMITIPGALFLILGIYHFLTLPKPSVDKAREVPSVPQFVRGYLATFMTFFKKPGVGQAIAFILLFRLAEGQVLAMVAPFLKSPLDKGGLALSTQMVGVTYGTFGMIGIIVGGILAGWLVSKYGVKKWYWPMIFIMHLPNLAFLYLAFTQNNDVSAVSVCLFIEQFGYGFGFTVFMLYLMYFTRGELQTSHYAIATGFMAAGVMLPQMATGYIQQALGFKGFFGYIAVCTLPSFAVAWMAWKDQDFLDYFEPKKVEPEGVGITPE
ncbi:MAG: MFS transporter, partial [Candidatus Eremiobacteraeota bacterium]|nr:MFS transporter [Candidatus Eremiobacteraeota bacterium]